MVHAPQKCWWARGGAGEDSNCKILHRGVQWHKNKNQVTVFLRGKTFTLVMHSG
ncbi:hypothetical protein WN55_03744 [Dufourea novaeangliae]|uniref:Uncharacterized protein n=1 Tax=Dufourea novaeangliae TaxID=178035 RepID=A0A154PLX5_DUFNO|nr:hypothetical protein WN55_03744 [Dufourea novaeangliae]